MKLWQKGKTAHKKVDQFTVGKDREYDLVLAQYCLLYTSPSPRD